MFALFAATPLPIAVAMAALTTSTAVKYLAALLVLSQGSLIYTYGYKFTKPHEKKVRAFCLIVCLLHFACAGLILYYSS